MDFENYLDTNARKIDQEVDLILIEFLNEAKKTNIKLVPFVLGLINSCKGGKRIRGVLVKLGYDIASDGLHLRGEAKLSPGSHPFGSEPQGRRLGGEILKMAAAFEILHAAFLIHDDIMDQSPTRRGQPSLYQALGGDHYGFSQAINIGDIGLYLPIKIIVDSSFLGEYKLKALSCLSQIIINTGWGQIMDVELTQLGHTSGESKPTPEVIRFINLYKTAKYTIAGPLQIGAILGGAEEKLIGVLGEFGEKLGIAFQIRDDILDGEVESVDDEATKALEYALRAKKVIPSITSDDKMRKLLKEMCEFMVNRDK